MFNDKYKKDNDIIKADEPLKAYIKNKMKDEAKKRSAPPVFLKRAVAFALCLCLVFGAVFAHFKISNLKNVPTQSDDITSEVSQTIDTADHSFERISHKKAYTLAKDYYDSVSFGRDYGNGYNMYQDEEMLEATTGTNDMQAPSSTKPSDNKNQSDFSTTNVQVENVDEGDIIKTDGKYIYTLSYKNCTFSIISALNGKMQVLSTTKVSENSIYDSELYIFGDKVIIISTANQSKNPISGGYGIVYKTTLNVQVFDCNDKENPTLAKSFMQDGTVDTSRISGDYLYLISNVNHLYEKPDASSPETYLPCYRLDGTVYPVDNDGLYLSADSTNSYKYTFVTVFNLKELSMADNVAVLGRCDNVYMNGQSLYVCMSKIKENETSTLLSRFAVADGKVELAATGAVPGTVLNQFSLDEYNNHLRLVTTVINYTEHKKTVSTVTASGSNVEDYIYYTQEEKTNSLYVLDLNLNITGKIEKLAQGEQIYSARFMGNTAYFVTFRLVDPLFSADLSDPENPKILGELKIPGFSKYLHPFGKDMLFGFGKDADEKSGATKGLKLSMFNISDPANVTEKSKLTLIDKYSPAEYNHKAFLISYDKNLIGFPGQNCYYVFNYTNNQFNLLAEIDITDLNEDSRMIYIGDYAYVYTDFKNIRSFSLENFTLVDSVTF